jgi:hypothetical protein
LERKRGFIAPRQNINRSSRASTACHILPIGILKAANSRKYQKVLSYFSLINCLQQGTRNVAVHSGDIRVFPWACVRKKACHVPNGRISEYLQVSETVSCLHRPASCAPRPQQLAMAPIIPMPSALTFELIARCSVIPTIYLKSHKLTQSRLPKLAQRSLPFRMDRSNYHCSCQSQRKPHSKD